MPAMMTALPFPLILFALFGMLLFAAANNLLTTMGRDERNGLQEIMDNALAEMAEEAGGTLGPPRANLAAFRGRTRLSKIIDQCHADHALFCTALAAPHIDKVFSHRDSSRLFSCVISCFFEYFRQALAKLS